MGADWFQLFDETKHGRADGENFNFGRLDIQDRPYVGLTSVFERFNVPAIRENTAPRLDARSGVPPAPQDPLRAFLPPTGLLYWDREHGFIKPVGGPALSDLYFAWSAKILYLGLCSLDIVEAAYCRDAAVPKIDRPLLSVRIGGRPVARARIEAGREPLWDEPHVQVENSSSANHNLSNVAAMGIP